MKLHQLEEVEKALTRVLGTARPKTHLDKKAISTTPVSMSIDLIITVHS